MGKLTDRFIPSLEKVLSEDNKRSKLQFNIVLILFFIVSTVMTIINVFTKFYLLMWITLIFALLSIINIAFSLIGGKLQTVSYVAFAVEVIGVLTAFTIIGEPEGFGIIWSALVPCCGMLLYRKKFGSIVSLACFAVLVFFMWIPIGRELLMYDYSSSFMLRFPIFYFVSFIASYAFETVREITWNKLVGARDVYEHLSQTDTLTGLGNDAAYHSKVFEMEKKIERGGVNFGIVFMDLNCVKSTNDAYGHSFGCHLIVRAGKTLPQIFKTSELYHTGGDEFVAIVTGDDLDNIDSIFEKFAEKLEYNLITYDGKQIVLSVARGFSVYKKGDTYDDVYQRADKDMYKNKKLLKSKYNVSER